MNAIKFTERGEVAVEAVLAAREDGKATVRFTVTDTGIGIGADQIGALFSSFVQADASTTRKYGGTGLGLAICRELAGLMGGAIGVESREGEGSAFWFTAVFGAANPHAAQPVREAGSEPAIALVGAKGPASRIHREARILVVEDNPVNRTVALMQLQKLGYRASAAVNGAEAIQALEQGSYDLVLMDCQMPVMDGFEATRRIRASGHPGIPVIALTANAMQSDRERCLAAGMNDYMAKPMELRQLADILDKWLSVALPSCIATADSSPPESDKTEVVSRTSVFNIDALLGRLMGDRQLAAILLGGFLADAPSQLSKLRARLDEADAPGIRLQAHTLKGAAATVAAEDLCAIATALERAATGVELDRCGALLPCAVEELERFRRTLERDGWVTAAN
jgi:CheY-like chemotaxis protein